jgi:hypothetical protein
MFVGAGSFVERPEISGPPRGILEGQNVLPREVKMRNSVVGRAKHGWAKHVSRMMN